MLLDKYLPHYSFRESHCCNVAADAETIIDAAVGYRPEADPFFRSMIGLRELPMRLGAFLKHGNNNGPAPFGIDNFMLLQRQEHELAYGLIGRFWRPDFGLITVADDEAFANFDRPGIAKLVLGFTAAGQDGGVTCLTTETRIYCPDRSSRLKFTPYWYLIRPISGWIRMRILNDIKKSSETAKLQASR